MSADEQLPVVPVEPAGPAKGVFVKDLAEGVEVEGVFLVKRKSLRRTRDGRPFLGLVLYDRSGAVEAQVWDDAQAFRVSFAERDYLRVRAVVDRYRERLSLRVLTCEPCRSEELSPEDFMPASTRPLGEMKAELRLRIRGIRDPYLRALLERVESDADLVNALALAPAASAVHHDFVGGLLEHTLSLMALCDAVARIYRDVDRDLLLTGAFLHDLGKVRELDAAPGFPYTDEGQLIGHIVLGYEIAMRKIDSIPGFPPELRTQLGHIILSHQGEYEWGSPKRPKTLEALVLHYLDNLDSKVAVFRKAADAAGAAGMDQRWTEYVRSLGRALYRGSGFGGSALAGASGRTPAGSETASRTGPQAVAPGPTPPDLFDGEG